MRLDDGMVHVLKLIHVESKHEEVLDVYANKETATEAQLRYVELVDLKNPGELAVGLVSYRVNDERPLRERTEAFLAANARAMKILHPNGESA